MFRNFLYEILWNLTVILWNFIMKILCFFSPRVFNAGLLVI